MRFRHFPFWAHILFLLLLGAGLVALWMLPALMMGYSFKLPGLLSAYNFAETGLFSYRDAIGRYPSVDLLPVMGVPTPMDGRFFVAFLAFLSQWIAWSDFMMWNMIGAIVVAGACISLWFFVCKLFDSRTAWIAAVIMGLMPLYVYEASFLHMFQSALFFLLLSIAVFVWMRKYSHYGSLIGAGFLFGLSIASKDVFLIFLPWTVVSYLYVNRMRLKKSIISVVVFLLCSGAVYITPYIGDIKEFGYPMNWNLAHFWPGGDEIADLTYEHMYPDPYTYYFDREWFDARTIERVEELSLLGKLQEQKVLRAYEVVDTSILESLMHGVWLTLNNIPPYFHQGTVGGAFIWIFVLIGMAYLFRRDIRLCVFLVGLMVSSELVIRFALHYNRIHAMDTAWVLAIFAALGITETSLSLWERVRVRVKENFIFSANFIVCVITLIIALQLLQTNRIDLAKRYARTHVPQTLIAGQALAALPDEAIVATDRSGSPLPNLAYLGGRTIVPFTRETILHLLEEGDLREAFKTYEVTHIINYPEELEKRVQRAVPGIKIVQKDAEMQKTHSLGLFKRYILHMVR
jgi:4-amino-4-deoxy-L-arabinose transferase-like glycosyltransferase